MTNTRPKHFELLLFTTDTAIAKECMDAGVDAIITDWENKGKSERQKGFFTQINNQSAADLNEMRKAVGGKIICRINGYNEASTKNEVEAAIDNGANEILLPMVSHLKEPEQVLHQINGRCGFGILVETDNAVKIAAQLAQLPLSRVYVGLNDLHIDKKLPNLFYPFLDDTISYLRSIFYNMPFGVGGLTQTAGGEPIPSSLLMNQYALLQTNFTFLRRSFLKDLQFAASAKALVSNIRNGLDHAKAAPLYVQQQKEAELKDMIKCWKPYELAETSILNMVG